MLRAGTIPEAPPWLIDEINRPEPPPEKPRQSIRSTNGYDHGFSFGKDRGEAYAQKALDNLCAELAISGQGDRNNTLNKAAHRMARMRDWIGRSEVERDLFAAAEACGLLKDDGAGQVRKTIKSGYDSGLRAPHVDLPEREEQQSRGPSGSRQQRKDHWQDPEQESEHEDPDDPDDAPRSDTLKSARASSFELTAIQWLWPGRFALGKLAILGGLPDQGKGQILADMAARVTNGDEWPCEEGRAHKAT